MVQPLAEHVILELLSYKPLYIKTHLYVTDEGDQWYDHGVLSHHSTKESD